MPKKDAHFLFFGENVNENAVLLDGDEVLHICKVLRFGEGDEIRITDGKGKIFSSKIVKIKRDSALCEIVSTEIYAPPPCRITLAAGLPEKEKFEEICEMLAPLAVAKIVPLITKNCQKNYSDSRFEKVKERCRRKIISSVKQSLNPYITQIVEPIKLSDFASESEINLLADFDAKPIFDALPRDKTPPKSVCVFVGPPAGFSEDEIEYLSRFSQKIRLGNYRLRTELAAVAAVCALGQSVIF